MIAIALLLAPVLQTQAGLNVQVDRAYRAADAALNAQYRATMVVMAKDDIGRNRDLKSGIVKPDGGPTYQAALLTSQRAWLGYRDAQCRLAGFEYRGGTSEGMAAGQCLTTLTRARTAELGRIEKSLGNQ